MRDIEIPGLARQIVGGIEAAWAAQEQIQKPCVVGMGDMRTYRDVGSSANAAKPDESTSPTVSDAKRLVRIQPPSL